MSTKSVCSATETHALFRLFLSGAFSLTFFLSCVGAVLAFDGEDSIGSASTSSSSDDSNPDGDWALSRKISNAETQMQFRVDNIVKLNRNEREVSFKSSTVFYDDLVFDFVGDNGEIVIYSFSEEKFALLDPIRRMRTELNLEEIERFLERVKPILRDKNDKFVNFMIDPSFEISKKEDELFFQSKFIDYHVATRSFENEQVADAYFEFTNALGKLNVYMNPGTVTPLARLEANKRLKEGSRFPEKIVTDVYPRGKTIFNKTVHITNEFSLSRRLSERDRNRVNRTIHYVAQFPLVSFQTYFEKTGER